MNVYKMLYEKSQNLKLILKLKIWTVFPIAK
uniref:Uncharacterized protein n=1 Tax=Heterorhabditis bacteriophora TaxID=37862 RepID=A0A1I7WUQ0_HETBA